MQQPTGEGVIVKQGWLEKEGGTYKSWKKRWTVLTHPQTLTYYKKKGGEKMGTVSLKGCGPIQECSYKNKKNCFHLVTEKRNYYFVADSPESAKSWLQALIASRDGTLPKKKTTEARLLLNPFSKKKLQFLTLSEKPGY